MFYLLLSPWNGSISSRRCNCAGGQSPRSLIPTKRDGEPSNAFTMVRVGLGGGKVEGFSENGPFKKGLQFNVHKGPQRYFWCISTCFLLISLFQGNHGKSRLVKYHQNNHGNQWNMVGGRARHQPSMDNRLWKTVGMNCFYISLCMFRGQSNIAMASVYQGFAQVQKVMASYSILPSH